MRLTARALGAMRLRAGWERSAPCGLRLRWFAVDEGCA